MEEMIIKLPKGIEERMEILIAEGFVVTFHFTPLPLTHNFAQ